jgi:hypothetical protein
MRESLLRLRSCLVLVRGIRVRRVRLGMSLIERVPRENRVRRVGEVCEEQASRREERVFRIPTWWVGVDSGPERCVILPLNWAIN